MQRAVRALQQSFRMRALLLQRRVHAEMAQGTARIVGFAAIAAGVSAAIFAAGYAGGFIVVARGAPELVKTGTSAALLGLMGALVLSSLGHAAQAFFSAKDLWLWDSSPAPAWARFVDRSVETAVAALPTSIALGACGLSGIVLGAHLGVFAVVRAVVVVAAVAVVPLFVGVFLAHVGGSLLPAGKLRRVSLVIFGVGIALLLVWFRRARVEKIMSPEGAAELLEEAKNVSQVGPELSPSSLGAAFIVDASIPAFLLLLAFVGAVVLLAYFTHRLLSRRARSLAVDESPVGVLRGSLRDRMFQTALLPVPARIRPLVKKDFLAFARDPAQWGQLVLLLGVGLLYIVNADALRQGFSSMPEVGSAILPAMHTGLVCFIAAGLSVRFGFPQMGLEGPAIWILDGAPVRPREILRAKVISSLPVVAVYPAVIAVAGAAVMKLDFFVWGLTSILCCAVSAGIAAFAVGRGAVKPLFDAVSLSELAVGPGGFSTMVLTVVLSAVAAFGALLLGVSNFLGMRGEVGAAALFAALGLAIPLVVVISSARAALKTGERAFANRREDEAARDFRFSQKDQAAIAVDE